ncbi:MAG: hypothetical protein VYC34_00745, partial [Planctomycetota bacterium]|nr:hypothetical protein [Planctomycetota bacterium]
IKKISLAALAAASIATMGLPSPAGAGGDERHEVRAELGGKSRASGKADYRDRMRRGTIEQRFSVEVEDAKPGETLEVHVNGALFGTMTVDDLGRAELQFRTAQFIDDPGDGTPIDMDFPRLLPGDTITVGGLAGTFQLD